LEKLPASPPRSRFVFNPEVHKKSGVSSSPYGQTQPNKEIGNFPEKHKNIILSSHNYREI
jgi:hypothetical protein